MIKNSRFAKLINKINPIIIFVLLLFVSVVFDGGAIYGVNNSSLVAQERYIDNTKKEAGNDIHIQFSLGSTSEASRLSLISPINEYNSYRIKENGRCVSYVLRKDYEVKCLDTTFTNSYVVYDDQWNDNEIISHNRFVLSLGTYNELAKEDSIYISNNFMKRIPGLTSENAIGQKITINLNQEKEYIIAGVIRTTTKDESGIHFANLFDDSFVLLHSPYVYEYGLTDLLFGSTDDYFTSDYADFIKAYNKSYLSFSKSRLTVSSFDEEGNYKLGYTTSPNLSTTANDKAMAFLTILAMAVVSLIYIAILIFYDFRKLKLYYKIPGCIVLVGYQFGLAFYLAEQIKNGLFISQLSITIFIVFMVISLISDIFIFSLFNLAKKEEE